MTIRGSYEAEKTTEFQGTKMQKDPSEELWEELISQSLEDENGPELGPAAREHLSDGRAVYYSDDSFPGQTVKHCPDGHREIVAYDGSYRQIFIRDITLIKGYPRSP